MKVYLVVDSYQYDGGFTVEAAYVNPNKALIEQQRLRREEKVKLDKLNYSERRKDSRLEAILIEEIEVDETL